MSTFSRYFHTFLSRRAPSGGRGFTLVELLVVIAIVLIITTFVLMRHARFNSTTLLRSLSYGVALSVRQAQVYGTSVRGFVQNGTTVYAPGYGVRFSSTEPTRYFLFADRNGDRAWDDTETVATTTLGKTFTIKSFCAVTAGGVSSCYTNDGVSNDTIDALTLYFRRPNPEALIYTNVVGTYAYAYVEFQSGADTGDRSIKVTSVGQIAVCGLDADIAAC